MDSPAALWKAGGGFLLHLPLTHQGKSSVHPNPPCSPHTDPRVSEPGVSVVSTATGLRPAVV